MDTIFSTTISKVQDADQTTTWPTFVQTLARLSWLPGWLAVDVKVDENCRKAGSQIYLTWQRHQRR